MDARSTHVRATVWLSEDWSEPLHDGRAIEYVITIADGKPQSYQRTVYEDGAVEGTHSSACTDEVPDYVRDEVNKHLIPQGAW